MKMSRHFGYRRFGINFVFEPRDLWVGAFLKGSHWEGSMHLYEVYVCIIPCFPVLITVQLR